MRSYRPLMSIALFLSIGGCSDSAQFNNATASKVLNAERIINPDTSVFDPSADASAPTIDPATGLPVEGSGTGGISEGGSAGGGTIGGGGTGSGGAAGPTAPGAGGGGSTVGGGSTSGPSPETIADNVEKLKATCGSGVKKTLKQSIHFPEVQKCSWGTNGNLGRRDTYVQAIEGQRATIELPINAQLCELGIGSVATTIQYDDFMLLTLNNQVLLTSNKELLVGMQEDQAAAYAWDFTKIRGKQIDFDAAPYCLGDASLCKIPVTDVKGAFQFSIDPSSLGKLAANSVDKKKLDFALYATGDNDDRDCWHTAFTLDFTLNYVE
jgi:hypothetical protein